MTSARNIDKLLKSPSGVYSPALNTIPIQPGGVISAQPIDDNYSIMIEIIGLKGDIIRGQIASGSGYYPETPSDHINDGEIIELSQSKICGVHK